MRIVCFEITLIYFVVRSASFPVEYGDEDDDSGHLGHIYNTGSPLYFGGDHQHEYDDYPGYDGYASYAPHHDHQHYAYPRYKFEYGVHDPHTGDIKKQYEERDGDTVRGFYSLVEPDGSIRIVEYTADDKNGFQATVKKIGPSHHPPSVPTYHSPEEHHHHAHHGHHHAYDDHPHHNPYPAISNYYPHPYPQNDDEDNGFIYHGYEPNDYKYPGLHGYGEHNNAYYHYGLGGQEYEENEDYPYNSNTNYATYILPQNTYSTIQDLTSYDGSQEDIENPNKFYNKRSPMKKQEIKEVLQSSNKDGSTKLHRAAKKLENVDNIKEKNISKSEVTSAESKPDIKSQAETKPQHSK